MTVKLQIRSAYRKELEMKVDFSNDNEKEET